CPARDREDMGGDRSTQPLIGGGGGYRVDEALARRADEERKPERFELGKARNGRQTLLRRLAEADPWVEHDVLARNAGVRGEAGRKGKNRADVGDDIDGWARAPAVMHDDPGPGTLRNAPGELAIALQAPPVVNEGGARRERPGRDLGLHRVDG